MSKMITLSIALLLVTATAWGESASERYNELHCAVSSVHLEKAIEKSLQSSKALLHLRLILKGLKNEPLGKILDISVHCADSTKRSYVKNSRTIVSAFYQIRSDLCRFQFSTDSLQDPNAQLSFDYIHCVSNF